MFINWIHWQSQLTWPDVALLLLGTMLVDMPRYTLSRVVMFVYDFVRDVKRVVLRGHVERQTYDYCPSVCIILAGYNEAESVGASIESLVGKYPRLEIIVIDDGSLDGMINNARPFGKKYDNVLVLGRPDRGGKSSAMNFALPYTRAEILITVDCDTSLGPAALWECVQPFRDPRVGAVSATVFARNPFVTLCTWMQAYEYLQSIFIGRMVAGRIGILGITSGAFACLRREAVERTLGWDVGPGEDLDLTLRIRKLGYTVRCAPYADCLTDVPTRWKQLWKQRLRWEEAAVVRQHCRKHLDLANPTDAAFRWTNFFVSFEVILINLVFGYVILFYIFWVVTNNPSQLLYAGGTFYILSLCLEFIHVLTLFYYSRNRLEHLATCLVFPLTPIYQSWLITNRIVAYTREIFWRTSFRDNFVPQHVRDATWKW
jgi:cellulose synthase/poly-beta-1,6-N-acetylglucosamine synthase-like glycosyltransferase